MLTWCFINNNVITYMLMISAERELSRTPCNERASVKNLTMRIILVCVAVL